MFKRSLLSLTLVASLACPMINAADTSKTSLWTNVSTTVVNGLNSAKGGIVGLATDGCKLVLDNKYKAGALAFAAVSVFAYYAYNKYVAAGQPTNS